jgi:hypothetical protein
VDRLPYGIVDIFTHIIMAAGDDELPWTTSRCNRLLRPISSKLAKLRKELERPRSAGGEARTVSSAFATRGSPHKTTNFTRAAVKPRGFDKARDPDYRPDAKAGAGNKKTYGGRGARRAAGIQRSARDTSNASRPGEIAFTPLIARLGRQLHSSPQVQNSPLKKYAKNRGPLMVDVQEIQAPGDLQKLIQGLFEAYANLLQATTITNKKRWNGTRSLMGSCLRKLPAYIELEEHFAKLDREAEDDEDEDCDVGAEIYEQLESHFEGRLGRGWRPFKEVVRAHATSLLCGAITDGILDLPSLSVLATHCINVSAWDEAERLILAYVTLLEPVSIPSTLKHNLFERYPYLSAVKRFVDRSGRHRLMFDLLEHMIAFELLPLEWFATECMRPIWDRLARSTSDNDHRTIAHAFQFLQTITIAGMGLPDERLLEVDATGGVRRFVPSVREDLRQALDTTFGSLFTVLCSIALVSQRRHDDVGKVTAQRILWILDALILAISSRKGIQAEVGLLEPAAEDTQTFAQRASWTIFASVLLRLDSCRSGSSLLCLDVTNLISCLTRTCNQYVTQGIDISSLLGTLPALVSSTARGTGRIWKDDGFEQFKRLIQPMISLSGCRLPHKLWTLKRLALESAVQFACSTGKTEHMSYTTDIEKKMQTQGRLVIIPSPNRMNSPSGSGGFRWEEGIGEWVDCTPFVKQTVNPIMRKPMPALELLPTPVPSDDEVDKVLPGMVSNNCSIWESTDFDEEDDGNLPQSSPIKKLPRTSTSSLGKRQRASSPMVIVSTKRTRSTPPDSPITFYPELPEDKAAQNGPRRSRRSTNEIKILASRLRVQRSRTSLESGLRHQQRKTYA